MNRRILLLSLALVALAGSLGWLLRQKWLDARAHEQAVLSQPARVRALPPPPAVPAATPVSPAFCKAAKTSESLKSPVT